MKDAHPTRKNDPLAWLMLMVVAAAAGLLLSATDAVTRPVIEARAEALANTDRLAAFPGADAFHALPLAENAAVNDCAEALSGGTAVGYVATITVTGYKGPIEITAGLDRNGKVTGVAVGGAGFSETPGLGARVREEAFTAQFAGAETPVSLGKGVDAVSGATISSGAVVSGVNGIARYVASLSGNAPAGYDDLLTGAYTELPHDASVDRACKLETGYVVFVTAEGYHGAIHVAVALDQAGAVTAVAVDESDFSETAGLGGRVLEQDFLSQYVGKSGTVGVNPVDAESGATDEAEARAGNPDGATGATATVELIEDATVWIDAVSGATISSTAVTRAVNAAIAFVAALQP